MAPQVTAHEVSHATHLNLEEEERVRARPNPEPKAKQAVRSFAPLDLSRIEISDTTAPRSRHGVHGSGGAQSSVTKKVRRTERTISRVQERLQEAERRASEVPELEEKVAALKHQLKETKKWKDEAVIYKRMAAALQSKVRHTEASALHSHSVVLENMARAFEIQEQNDLLDSYPIASQVHSRMQSQFNSPLSRNNCVPTTSQQRTSQNQGLGRRNKQFLDEVSARVCVCLSLSLRSRAFLSVLTPLSLAVFECRGAGSWMGRNHSGDLRQGGQEDEGVRREAEPGRDLRGPGALRRHRIPRLVVHDFGQKESQDGKVNSKHARVSQKLKTQRCAKFQD